MALEQKPNSYSVFQSKKIKLVLQVQFAHRLDLHQLLKELMKASDQNLLFALGAIYKVCTLE